MVSNIWWKQAEGSPILCVSHRDIVGVWSRMTNSEGGTGGMETWWSLSDQRHCAFMGHTARSTSVMDPVPPIISDFIYNHEPINVGHQDKHVCVQTSYEVLNSCASGGLKHSTILAVLYLLIAQTWTMNCSWANQNIYGQVQTTPLQKSPNRWAAQNYTTCTVIPKAGSYCCFWTMP